MKRIQLTMFLDKSQSNEIEKIRKIYNPIQQELIEAHITLCTEDELWDLDKIKNNLRNLKLEPLKLKFGEPQRFSDGKGVLLPVLQEYDWFHSLRKLILFGISETPKEHMPHLTLMHPRNSTCTDSIFQEIKKFSLPKQGIVRKVSLIQQLNQEKWEILEEFEWAIQS